MITTLKKRAEFQRVRGGARATAVGFVLEGKARVPVGDDKDAAISAARFGFTITKKIGNAVTRNKIRRRLRAALSELAPLHAQPDMDYVVVARLPAASQEFALLVADLTTAFQRVHAPQKPQRSSKHQDQRVKSPTVPKV